MNLHENVKRIKEVMGILKEETEQDLRKIMTDKFASFPKYGTIERQGEYIVTKYFSKSKDANTMVKYKPTDDFLTSELLDGPEKGRVVKIYADASKKREFVTKTELQTKFEERIKNFPCLAQYDYYSLRQTSDGKLVVGHSWGNDSDDYVVYFNLDDKTYTIKGGPYDGEQGQFSCNGNKIKWGKVTRSGTKKGVVAKEVPDDFEEVTLSNPIVYGMRDHTPEPYNGLIYRIQKRLKELKLYDGDPDGQFGPKTLKAVKEFQKTATDSAGKPLSLVVDGKVGPNTIFALGLTD